MNPHRPSKGFTLIELLVVLAIVGILSALLVPAISRGMDSARGAVCRVQLGLMQASYEGYLSDHGGRFFPFREFTSEGVRWYWGLERQGAAEGSRSVDRSQSRLAPYTDEGGIEVCPSLVRNDHRFKAKFSGAGYGYGINAYLLSDWPQLLRRTGQQQLFRRDSIGSPIRTIAWADSAQVNTWQPPASPGTPMIEEWYYLSSNAPAKFHFRHGTGRPRAHAAYMDGHVGDIYPYELDPRADGRTGYLAPPGNDERLAL